MQVRNRDADVRRDVWTWGWGQGGVNRGSSTDIYTPPM